MSSDRPRPDPADWGVSTRAVWGGEPEENPEGATVAPVFYGVTFAYDDLNQWAAVGAGHRPGHIYSRNTNPTVGVAERKVAALEGAERATAFATGMAAISGTLFALLEPGARVVSVKDTYGGTNRLFTDFLPAWDVEVALRDTGDHGAIEAGIDEGADLLYLETPTNPTLVGPPATTSHVELTPQQRAEAGIPESLVRYSVGIENGDDLVADLRAALDAL